MAKPLFINSKTIDAATLVASSAKSTLPVTNLQNDRPFKVWRSNSATGEYILVTLDAATALSVFAFVNPNFNQVKLEAATTADGLATPALTVGPITIWPAGGKPVDPEHPVFIGLVKFVNTTEYKYWKVTPSDSDDDYFEMGRMMCDIARQTTNGLSVDITLGFDNMDEYVVTDFNSNFSDKRGNPARAFILPFGRISDAEAKEWFFPLIRYCGKAHDFIFCANPADPDYMTTVQLKFPEVQKFQFQTVWVNGSRSWNVNLTAREVL